ncbi:hypothetical protein COOONC_19733 [Cooperia oncophora]
MRFAILFFIALLALTLARPHSSDSSDSDEQPHRGKPHHHHHKHHHRHTHRPPPPPQTVAPVTTDGSPVVSDIPSDAPSNPTEFGPIVTTGGVTTEIPEVTSASPEGTVGSVSVGV